MDNCWISCQVKADMRKVYDDIIIINLYKNWLASIFLWFVLFFEKLKAIWEIVGV